MPLKSRFRVGTLAVLAALFLSWAVPACLPDYPRYPSYYLQLAAVIFWFCISLAGAGAFLILRTAFALVFPQSQSSQPLRVFPAMTLRNVLPLPRFKSLSLIAQLPNFGLICGAVLWILIFLFMIVEQPRTFYGLPIDLRTHEILAGPRSPVEETLSVYLATGEKYYVNGQEVRRETLRAKLREELSHRAVWMVYFEGDYDTLNMDAIYAMNVIQSLGAELIWLTPRVRQQLAQGEKSGTGIGGAPEKAVATSVLRR